MRIRTIKPDFFHDEELAGRPPLERLLFAGLWLQADRDGRLEDRPARIKAQALPYDDCNCDEMLSNLAAAGYITRYAVGDKKLIQVRTFTKHQRPNKHEPESELPGPPTKHVRARAAHMRARGEGKGMEGNGKEGKETELDRLLIEPEIRALAELWVQELEHAGAKVTVGLARACQRFFAAGYEYIVGADAIYALKIARDPSTRDQLPAKCFARWCAEHNDKPGYVLRPEKVEEIAADLRKRTQPSQPLTPPPQPRPLRERDDRPATPEEMERIRADRAAAFEAEK